MVQSLCGAAIYSSTWSSFRDHLAAQVVMQVPPDCLIVVIYAVVGLVTRGVLQERTSPAKRTSDEYDGSKQAAERFVVKSSV